MEPTRIAQLRASLDARGIGGAVLRHPANVRYITGLPATPWPVFALFSPTASAVVAPGDSSAIRTHVGEQCHVFGYQVPGPTIDLVADVHAISAAALAEALASLGLAGLRIGVEEAQISALHAAVVGRFGKPVPIDGEVEALRRIKDASELALIQSAVRLNDAGFAAAKEVIAQGVSELDVQNAVVSAMQNAAGVPIDVLDDTNCFISGPNADHSVGLATPRRLERSDLMIVDINPFIHGYKGDTTRTFSVGPAEAGQQKIHDTLVRALLAAEAVARPGTRACDVYKALAGTISDAGYGAGLRAHGGHAIGLEHLERPYIIPGDEMVLEVGMVLSLEPGVYGPQFGGLRLEDNYVVTAKGLELLSHYPRQLVQCD